jgi:hypothetical protein
MLWLLRRVGLSGRRERAVSCARLFRGGWAKCWSWHRALSAVACLKTRYPPKDLKVPDSMRLCGDRDISDTISTSSAFDSFIILPRQHITRSRNPPTSILEDHSPGHVVVSLARIAAGDDFPRKRGGRYMFYPPSGPRRNASSRTRRPLFYYGERNRNMAMCRCARAIVPDRRRLPCFDAASYCMSV